jgi:predicted dehydrogenase
MLKIGIIGAGNIAKTFIEAVIKGNVNVTLEAIASRDILKAIEYKNLYSFKKAYGSYQDLYNDFEVDLIYVATPHSFHYEQMLQIIDHNKHVICEKPFTLNSKQAEEVFKKAKEKNLFVMEALWTRFLPTIKELKELINKGIIGEIEKVEANFCFKTNLDQNHRLRNLNLGGGALLDLGVYTITFANIFLGKPESISSKVVMDEQTGVDIDEEIVFKYKDNKLAILNSSIIKDMPSVGTIYGEKGYVLVENFHQTELAKIYNYNNEIIGSIEHPHSVNGFEYEILSAIDSIEKGRIEDPHIPHSETIKILKQMDDIRQSWNLIYPQE